ncbi:MAG: PaaI family thioesterase [Promethearchaeota archaeon]|nr:MAG: PaaI family thioesterase [Candidatus Lokiarchaeota archaeon]
MKQKTHNKLNNNLCGIPIELKEGYSKLKLIANRKMILDDSNLIHGGFTFSLADYAAMLAVNHPNVVLTEANVRFIKPVILGDILIAEAYIKEKENRRILVEVKVSKDEIIVFEGEFKCYIPETHILGGKNK